MKRRMKKSISVMLVLAICISASIAFPAVASAEDTPPVRYCRLRNVATGKYLNVYGSRSTSGTNVTIWPADGTKGQKFSVIDVGLGFSMVQPHCTNTCVLNAHGYYANPGDNVDIWTTTHSETQQWIFQYMGPYDRNHDAYVIRSRQNPDVVLTATGNANGANVNVSKRTFTVTYYEEYDFNLVQDNLYQMWVMELL